MMAGDGPFGAIGMGGMFTTVKVRKDQKPGDYRDPGWYKHPAGSVAYEWTGALPEPVRGQGTGKTAKGGVEMTVRKPAAHGGH
jgi:hypothetical protein